MRKEKVIEILEDLKCYIDENWDVTEYAEEIKENCEAIDFAVAVLKSSNVCGTLVIDGVTYQIFK